jgi:membrane associated rhomboid family serine protease
VPLPLRWRYKLDRWRESLAAFRPKPQAARPRLCPTCGTLVGATSSKCHQCGASLHFSLVAVSRSLSGLLPTESPVTYVVLGLNSLLFIVSLLATMRAGENFNLLGGISGQVLFRLGARHAYEIVVQHELWRLVMPIFLHGSILHIAMNTWVMMDVGPQVEEVYGSARYLFLYVATGIVSFIASTAWSVVRYGYAGGGIGIGASGALMGLIGLMLAITTLRGGAYMRMIRGQLIKWVVYILAFGILISGIDNAAHLGGLAAGFLLGKVMADREPADATERKRAYLLGWSAGVVVAASFAFMLMHYFRPAG